MPLGFHVRHAVATAGVSCTAKAHVNIAAIAEGPPSHRAPNSATAQPAPPTTALRHDPPERTTAAANAALAAMLKLPSGTAGQSPSPPRYTAQPSSDATVSVAVEIETPAMSPVRRMRASCGHAHEMLTNVASTANVAPTIS